MCPADWVRATPPSPKIQSQEVAAGALVSVNVTVAPTPTLAGIENSAPGGVGETVTSVASLKLSSAQAARTLSVIGSLLPVGGWSRAEVSFVVWVAPPFNAKR